MQTKSSQKINKIKTNHFYISDQISRSRARINAIDLCIYLQYLLIEIFIIYRNFEIIVEEINQFNSLLLLIPNKRLLYLSFDLSH